MTYQLKENAIRFLLESLEGPALSQLITLLARPLQARAMLQWASGEELPRTPFLALPSQLEPQLRNLEDNEQRPVMLRDPALSFPWSAGRLERALQIPPGEWRYDSGNHRIWLVKPLGMLIFYNGMHSGTAGILQGGAALARVYNMNYVFAQGLTVEWTDNNATALYSGRAYCFEYPEWGLLWWAAFVLWESGKTVNR